MNLAQMERAAHVLEGRDPLADVLELADLEESKWNDKMGRIRSSGVPRFGYGPYQIRTR